LSSSKADWVHAKIHMVEEEIATTLSYLFLQNVLLSIMDFDFWNKGYFQNFKIVMVQVQKCWV